jgi:uncharacterized protein YeaO (DUF488 family)
MKRLFTGYYARHGKLAEALSISVVVPKWYPRMRHFPSLAPTWKLVEAYKMGEIGWREYSTEYLSILERRGQTATEIVAKIPEGSVLLCYERPPEFCHRHLAAEWLMRSQQCTVEEMK